jgi:hypothetical protein
LLGLGSAPAEDIDEHSVADAACELIGKAEIGDGESPDRLGEHVGHEVVGDLLG